MIKFLIHDKDGNLIRKGQCDEVDYEFQARDGEFISKGDAIIPDKKDSPMFELRGIRNFLLKNTDWTQMPDAPLSDDKKEQYRIYRQKLRDLPAQFYDIINLEDVTFPEVDDV